MKAQAKTVTIFGGTGFIGTQIVREMAKKGWVVKIATRVPERAYFLRPCGTVGQIVPLLCDYSNEKSIAQAVRGSDFVVNCVGILYERGKSKFARAHIDVPQMIAKACKKEGVERFVHISSLACDKGSSKYAQSKLDGEKAVRKAFKDVTILRPSVVFGPGDDFFNMFAALSVYAPVLPLIGGGKTKFQPVYVGDVADAVLAALNLPALGDKSPLGKVYELGGPEIIDFKEIYARLTSCTERKRCQMSLPWGLAKFKATLLGVLPKPLLTRDQVESLKTDNVISGKEPVLSDLGVNPTGMTLILPQYLGRYRSGGRFADKKRA